MRATTCGTPKVSRATRALMMFELSPLLTAANAPAESMPASSSVCRSKPRPVTWRPPKSGPSRRNASGSWSITATLWPISSSRRAIAEPTRPQPITTTCTNHSSGDRRGRGWPAAPGAKLHPRGGPERPGRTDLPWRRGAPPGKARGAAPTYDRRRAPPVRPRTTTETPRPRPPRPERPGRRVAAAQASRAADLRQRPVVVGGVRDAGDPAHPHAGRDGVPLPGAVAGGGRRPASHRGGALLPAGRARLSLGRRRLRGRHEEPRAVRWAGGGQRAAHRLRAHGGGLGQLRHRQHHLGVPVPARAPVADRDRAG